MVNNPYTKQTNKQTENAQDNENFMKHKMAVNCDQAFFFFRRTEKKKQNAR